MKKEPLIVAFVLFATLLACGGGVLAFFARLEQRGHAAWVSGFADCPSSSNYGELVADSASLFRTPEMRPPVIARIPHGTAISILSGPDSDKLYLVRYGSEKGYIQSSFVVVYDPKDGPWPNQAACP